MRGVQEGGCTVVQRPHISAQVQEVVHDMRMAHLAGQVQQPALEDGRLVHQVQVVVQVGLEARQVAVQSCRGCLLAHDVMRTHARLLLAPRALLPAKVARPGIRVASSLVSRPTGPDG
jgi:hypothetical protein